MRRSRLLMLVLVLMLQLMLMLVVMMRTGCTEGTRSAAQSGRWHAHARRRRIGTGAIRGRR